MLGPPESPTRRRAFLERMRRMLNRGVVPYGELEGHARITDEEDQLWGIMMMEEEERLRREEQARREERRRQEEEEWTMRRTLRRGIPSFAQEHNAFGYSSKLTQQEESDWVVVQGLEQVTASPEFDAKRLFLKRVSACIGWAVHGIVFEFVDNTRMGCILDGFAETRMPLTDDSMRKRLGVHWQDVEYGDYIVGIHGNRLHNTNLLWLCHTVVLEFRSGKCIRFESRHEPWRGEPFSYQVPQPCLVYRVAFRHELTQDMRGLVTSIHLPLAINNIPHLPLKNKQTVDAILHVTRDFDMQRESQGRKPLSDDLWWNILGWIRAWEMPVSTIDGNEDSEHLCSLFGGLSTR